MHSSWCRWSDCQTTNTETHRSIKHWTCWWVSHAVLKGKCNVITNALKMTNVTVETCLLKKESCAVPEVINSYITKTKIWCYRQMEKKWIEGLYYWFINTILKYLLLVIYNFKYDFKCVVCIPLRVDTALLQVVFKAILKAFSLPPGYVFIGQFAIEDLLWIFNSIALFIPLLYCRSQLWNCGINPSVKYLWSKEVFQEELAKGQADVSDGWVWNSL